MLKDQLFKKSGLKFDNLLFGPEKLSGLSRNRPQAKKHEALNHRGKKPLEKLAEVQFEPIMTDRRIKK